MGVVVVYGVGFKGAECLLFNFTVSSIVYYTYYLLYY
ncbi:MAG: hypothetical protein ACI90V_007126 [Bacillariaceae sp.]|jgi:hypothetical protein